MSIKNIIFDIGNVIVRWAPLDAIAKVFPEEDPIKFNQLIRPIWIDLNLGKLSLSEAIQVYQNQFNFPAKQIEQLMHEFTVSQTPLPGSRELLQKLNSSGIPLYSITDNVREIMEYHHSHSNFLHYFEGIVVSADVGVLKPHEKIYRNLLDKYELEPAESLFIDDMGVNVKGALAVGIHAFQFEDAQSCEEKLIKLGVKL